MAALDVVIQLKIIAKEDVKVSKTYGEDIWEKKEDRVYKIKIPQLSTGISKNYVLNLSLPQIGNKKIEEVCEVIYQAKRVDGEMIKDFCGMRLKYTN